MTPASGPPPRFPRNRPWLCLAGAALVLAEPVLAEPAFVQNGTAGFVVSDIKYALAQDDKAPGEVAGACPHGMSQNWVEIYEATPAGKRRKGESDKDYGERVERDSMQLATASDGRNLCMNPEAGAPDPHFRTLESNHIRADGIPMDGGDTVRNQFFHVVGCSRSFQPTGLSNTFATEMLTGSWGILITLKGVHNLTNDKDVEVGIFANADPIELSPDRKPLAYATYAVDQDARFRARTHGHIENGVLTSDPVDFRFRSVVNGMHFERPLRHARLRATISADGTLTGYLSGYTPVDDMYNFQFGYRNGTDNAGKPAPVPLRLHTGMGAARVLGYTCPGAYFALQQYADGDRDPQTGRYTSISTQYRIAAIPASVVDVPTQSANATHGEKSAPHGQ